MDQWIIVGCIAVTLLLVASVLKALAGGAVRYLLFVLFAAVVAQRIEGEEGFGFISVDMASDLAVIAGIAFVITGALMIALFRNSKMKFLLFPAVGFGTTFAVTSVWMG